MFKTLIAAILAGGFYVAEGKQIDEAFAALGAVQQQQAVALAQIEKVRGGQIAGR
jgi:hypothetical protein